MILQACYFTLIALPISHVCFLFVLYRMGLSIARLCLFSSICFSDLSSLRILSKYRAKGVFLFGMERYVRFRVLPCALIGNECFSFFSAPQKEQPDKSKLSLYWKAWEGELRGKRMESMDTRKAAHSGGTCIRYSCGFLYTSPFWATSYLSFTLFPIFQKFEGGCIIDDSFWGLRIVNFYDGI